MEYVQVAKDYLSAVQIEPVLRPIKEIKVDRKLIAELAAAGLVGYGVYYLGKIWRSYGYFEKQGIKTPPYSFFYGNVKELSKKGHGITLVEWTKEYGKTYGYYEGHLPVLVTSDIELIDEIFYKQFSNFSGRKLMPQQLSDNGPDVNVFLASRNRWKRLRTISNQTFSPAKLKEMMPAMRMCSDRLISAIAKNLNKEVNISELLDQMAMDVVWNCTFGIDVDFIKNPDFIYYDKIRQLMNEPAEFSLFYRLTTYFYEFKLIILLSSMVSTLLVSQLSSKWGNPFFWLMNRIHEVIDKRVEENKSSQNSGKTKHDYVQLLLEAEADTVNLDFDSQHYESGSMKLVERKMTRNEILISLLGFMAAGFDTTASTLNFCFYVLLTHPDELIKLQEEVDSLSDFEYDSLNKLEYLDMFIKEILRMYPVGVSVQNRRCTKATTLKGIEIPEELQISVDVLSLHYDPEHWPGMDPNVFYPLRFAPNASYNKLAYMPFGAGPRICIGMRFALLEMKLTLVKIIKNFDMKSTRELDQKPVIREGALLSTRRPREPLKIAFSSRN